MLARAIKVSVLVILAGSGVATADPCTAIPEVGPTPSNLSPGSKFSGMVAYVGDGDSLCVALGPQPDSWVEVRLSDFYAPELSATGGREARAALEDVVLWKQATCVAENRTYDRIAARCTINGQPISAMLRTAGVREGGNGRRPQQVPATRRVVTAVSSSSGAFRNCAAARAAGAAPLYRGQPGYGAHMDGDGDGIACEPYRGR